LSDVAVDPLERTLPPLTSSEFRYASAMMLLNKLPRQIKWIVT